MEPQISICGKVVVCAAALATPIKASMEPQISICGKLENEL